MKVNKSDRDSGIGSGRGSDIVSEIWSERGNARGIDRGRERWSDRGNCRVSDI